MACSRNKPTGITAITELALDRIWKSTGIHELHGLGGNRGRQLREFLIDNGHQVTNLADLQAVVYSDFNLIESFYESVKSDEPHADVLRLKKALSGMDSTPVFPKVYSDSMSMSLTFKGKTIQNPRVCLLFSL